MRRHGSSFKSSIIVFSISLLEIILQLQTIIFTFFELHTLKHDFVSHVMCPFKAFVKSIANGSHLIIFQKPDFAVDRRLKLK